MLSRGQKFNIYGSLVTTGCTTNVNTNLDFPVIEQFIGRKVIDKKEHNLV